MSAMVDEVVASTTTTAPAMLRQGDILLRPVARMPGLLNAVPDEAGRVVLAHGEVTGHHHSFAMADRIALFREDGSGGGLFLSVGGSAPEALEHQEHSTLLVWPGTYEVVRQMQWSDADEPLRVED